MPYYGDQHRDNQSHQKQGRATGSGMTGGQATQWSKSEEQHIAHELAKQLGPEYTSVRSGPGGVNVRYMEGFKVFHLANDVFGFNGWSSQVISCVTDHLENNNGKISCCVSAVIRVSLKDGTFHEDIGHGTIDNAKSVAMAVQKCKKEAVTDGIKRALRQFGNAMGLCIYDKDYCRQIGRVKSTGSSFSEENLHRHSSYQRVAAVSGNNASADAKVERAAANTSHNNSSMQGAMPESDFGEYFDEDLDGMLFEDQVDSKGDLDQIDPHTDSNAQNSVAGEKATEVKRCPTLASERPLFVSARAEMETPANNNEPVPFVPSPSVVKTPGVDHSKSTALRKVNVGAPVFKPSGPNHPDASANNQVLGVVRAKRPFKQLDNPSLRSSPEPLADVTNTAASPSDYTKKKPRAWN